MVKYFNSLNSKLDYKKWGLKRNRLKYHLKNKLYDILHSRNLKDEKFIETINEWCLEAKSAGIDCLDDFSESLKGYTVV